MSLDSFSLEKLYVFLFALVSSVDQLFQFASYGQVYQQKLGHSRKGRFPSLGLQRRLGNQQKICHISKQLNLRMSEKRWHSLR